MARPQSSRKRIRLWLDIETEQFSASFRDARHNDVRLVHAPKMRLACVFNGASWHYFTPEHSSELLKLLRSCDEIITFNGKCFDELVLRRHHGLLGRFPTKGKHIDLCEIVFERAGYGVSLHDLAMLNLAERKHTKGRAMTALDLEGLKEACRSDVWQTHRLWELWRKNNLNIPTRRKRTSTDDDFVVGPGDYMPMFCPACHSEHTLIFVEHDPEEMSEGQEADYQAGMFGSAFCRACNQESDWGF